MKLSSAIKKLEKANWNIAENKGSYIAEKNGTLIRWFVNNGSDNCSKFTYEGTNSCSPTYGMSLKAAMGTI